MWYGSLVKFITKLRRDRWRDQVLTVSRRLRALQTARDALGSAWSPSLDEQIDQLTRRRDRLLTNLKETA